MRQPFDPNRGLDDLRRASASDDGNSETSLERATQELQLRSDPNRVGGGAITWPWSREARARSHARDLSLQARFDIFQDDLRSIRIANEVLNRAATMRAVEAAETAIFEIRCLGETTRFAILNRTHLDMTRQFVSQLEIQSKDLPRPCDHRDPWTLAQGTGPE